MTATAPFTLPLWPDAGPVTLEPTRPPYGNVPVPYVRNVVTPSLTVYLPAGERTSETMVIICPGGAYHILAVEHEGTQVAAWLNERGIAAAILRYRLLPTADDEQAFQDEMQARMADPPRFHAYVDSFMPTITDDGRQAVRLVRQHAAEWGINPERVAMIGFSAGAGVTIRTTMHGDAASRPNAAAPIYCAPPGEISVPDNAPALFLALASNDQMAVDASLPLYRAWQSAGKAVELHIYADGGHGFGMRKTGLPVDSWIERFGAWLGACGY